MYENLKSILAEFKVEPDQQDLLVNDHGIVDFETLKAKQNQVYRKELAGVKEPVQTMISMILAYMISLKVNNPISSFTKQGWMRWAASLTKDKGSSAKKPTNNRGSGSKIETNDRTGKSARKRKSESNPKAANNVSSDEETDSGGSNSEEKASKRRKVNPKEEVGQARFEEEEEEEEEEEGDESGEEDESILQGFRPSQSTSPESGAPSNESVYGDVDLDLEVVDYDGKRFRKGKCYHHKYRNTAILGIKSFKNQTQAYCVDLKHVSKTFLKNDEMFLEAISAQYNGQFAQYGKQRTLISLAALGDASSEPSDIPDLIYEIQTKSDKRCFGYTRDNSRRNQIRINRNEIRLLEAFAGAVSITILSDLSLVAILAL